MEMIIAGILILICCVIAVRVIIFELDKKEFDDSSYKEFTELEYSSVMMNKGKHGEYDIYNSLKSLESEGNKFLFNIVIPNGKRTTEIDVIMLDKSGIFVFESKNYSGWIFGKEDDDKWTSVLKGNRDVKSHKYHFVNPIKQNRTHINALKLLLGSELTYYSVIVFSDRCTFKNVTVSKETNLIKQYSVWSTTNKLRNDNKDNLSEEQIEDIYKTLLISGKKTKEEQEQHAIETKSAYESTEICPWCGRRLVLRNGKYGRFYGCSGYPECRYTKKSN